MTTAVWASAAAIMAGPVARRRSNNTNIFFITGKSVKLSAKFEPAFKTGEWT